MVVPFRFDRTWQFRVSPAELWDVLSQTNRYQSWWPWLRSFDAPDGLVTDSMARCLIRGPLPYSLSFRVNVRNAVPLRVLETDVEGDIRGQARLEVEETADGCRARLVWELDLRDQLLMPLALIARPALEWGHERVVSSGVEQFRRRALSESAPCP